MSNSQQTSGLAIFRYFEPFSRTHKQSSKKTIAFFSSVSFLLLQATTGCVPQRPAPPLLPPLLDAARTGNTAALPALFDHGATVEERDSHGRTALHWAAIGGNVQVVGLLLDRGADVDARAQFETTPLHWAALAGKAGVADLLLRRGADVRARNGYGMTPLHEAAAVDVVRVLLDRGAPVGAQDQRGMTPLHLARTAKVAKALMEAGANPFIRATDGRRPMEMSVGADWERDGLIIYAARASARLRGEQGVSHLEIRNISEREIGPLSFSAESPGCNVEVSPPSLPKLDPGQLFPLVLKLTRRPGAAEGEYPLMFILSLAGRPITKFELRLNTSRAETPEDRGMIQIGRASIRRAPSHLQYLAFAAVPLVLGGLWWLRRRRSGPLSPARPAREKDGQ